MKMSEHSEKTDTVTSTRAITWSARAAAMPWRNRAMARSVCTTGIESKRTRLTAAITNR